MVKKGELTGIDKLREVVTFFNSCREDFNDRFTAPQLIQLWEMYQIGNAYIDPDEWTVRQIKEALRGKAPQWDQDERPVYDD